MEDKLNYIILGGRPKGRYSGFKEGQTQLKQSEVLVASQSTGKDESARAFTHSYFHDQRWTWYFLRSYFHDQIRPGFLWTYFVSFETRENTKWDQNKSNVDGPNVHVPFVFTRSKVDMFYMGTKMASYTVRFIKNKTLKRKFQRSSYQ